MLRLAFLGWAHSVHTERWLGWFAERGHEIHLLTDHPAPIPGATLHDLRLVPDNRPRLARYLSGHFNLGAVNWLRTLLRIRAIIKALDPDILHIHNLYYPHYLGAFSSFRPLVAMPWDGDILWSPRRGLLHRWAVRHALRRADLVLTNSQEMADIVRAITGPRKLIVPRTGINLRHFHPMERDKALAETLGVEGCPTVISTRSLGNFYNIDVIIRAIPLVLREVPRARFVFVWHAAELRPQMEALIDELGVRDAVRLVGRVPYQDMPRYYSLADAFVSISSNDAIPAALLEGMACGVPPVTASLSTVNEWAKDGWNALVVPQRDVEATAGAAVRLLQDRDLAKLFVERNLALVKEKADLDERLSYIESLYYSLARREAPAPSASSGQVLETPHTKGKGVVE